MRRYYWDFFGPAAEGTAEHYHHHLDEFLAREGLTGCTTGVEAEDGVVSAWCAVPEEHRSVVERALRPRRYTGE